MKTILFSLLLISICSIANTQFDLSVVPSGSDFDTTNCRYDINARVSWVSGGDATNEPITVNFYFSTDLTLDARDFLATTRNITLGNFGSISGRGDSENVGINNFNGCKVITPGTYYFIVEYISDNGLDNNLSNNVYSFPNQITVGQQCFPEILNIDTSFCNNESIELLGNFSLANQTWFKNYGTGSINLNTAGTTYELNSTAVNTIGIQYYKIVGCADYQEFVSIDSTVSECLHSASLEENLINTINLFPNPNTGEFTIQNPLLGGISLEVFNANGNLIDFKKITKSITKISIKEKGVYFVTLTNKSNTVTKKVVIN